MNLSLRFFVGCWATAAIAVAGVQEPAPDKSRYSLFAPTPRELMRELSTDRPDKTECPFTVDAGHVQFEMDWVVYGRDHDTANGADRTETDWAIAPFNLKIGLTNRSDLQLVVEPYLENKSVDRTTSPAVVERTSGAGDVTLRYKFNFWGNDGGPSAFGVMPFIKLPVHGHGIGANAVEGGVILPYSRDLSGGWGLGMQTELDLLKNGSGHGYHGALVNSVTVGHALSEKLEGYAELYSEHSAERGSRWVGTLDFGVTYAATRDLQLDVGVNLGICAAAPDVELFTGISRRF